MNQENKCTCVLCGAKLDSKELLQEHFRKHANKEIDAKGNPIKIRAKYDNDNKNKASTDDLKINKITCDVCPMEFDTVTMAIQHKFRKHPESSAKHFCPFCGMQFPLKFTRDKHVDTHKNMSTFGSFPCSECGVIFHNAQAQNYHFKSTHKRIMSIFKPVPTPPPSKKIKINNANEAQSVYYCYLCGMEYIIKFNLQKHLERSHKEDERNKVPDDLIKCLTCDALFYNKKAYENHNMYHRPDDLYVTSEEQRLQTVTRVDQDFDIRRVQLVTDKFIPVDKPKTRRQICIKKVQQKTDKIEKTPIDDELSPASSIDSSDSENDSENIHKASQLKQKNKINYCKNDNEIIQEKISVEYINIPTVQEITEDTAEENQKNKVNETEIKVNEKGNETITIERMKNEIQKETNKEKKKETKKNANKSKKTPLISPHSLKRSLRSNTNLSSIS